MSGTLTTSKCVHALGRASDVRLAFASQQLYAQSFILSSVRHSSNSSQPRSLPSKIKNEPYDNSITSESYDSPVNAPASTLPAPLDLPPPREPGENVFGYYFKIGKGYLSFYKTGLKNAAWVNPKLAAPVIARWKESGEYHGLARNSWVTRGDLQLMKRRKYDLTRLPMFGLLFAVFGEFTPFVVIAFSNIVPHTCRVPPQLKHDREKLEKRKQMSFMHFLPPSSVNKQVERLEQLNWREKVHCSGVLGLHSSWWPSHLLPLPLNFHVTSKLKNNEQYLDADDLLIQKGGGVMQLNPRELAIACTDRAIPLIERSEQKQRADLQRWLSDRKRGVSIYERLLTR